MKFKKIFVMVNAPIIFLIVVLILISLVTRLKYNIWKFISHLTANLSFGSLRIFPIDFSNKLQSFMPMDRAVVLRLTLGNFWKTNLRTLSHYSVLNSLSIFLAHSGRFSSIKIEHCKEHHKEILCNSF